MTKIEAANFLGVSERALERYTASGRLTARYIKGKTRPTLDFEEDELERFKSELFAPVEKPATKGSKETSTTSSVSNEETTAQTEAISPNIDNTPSSSLAVFGGSSPVATSVVLSLQEATTLFQAASSIHKRSVPDARQAAVKLLLTLEEAQLLTGLSRDRLRRAISAGQLPAQQIGRAWRIKRSDLDDFIRVL